MSTIAPPALDASRFRDVIGHFMSGVAVITTTTTGPDRPGSDYPMQRAADRHC